MQENLPLTAKVLQYMKTLTQGTSTVPASRQTQDCNTLQERYYRSLTEDCTVKTTTDRWYIATIACTCATFIYPPCVLIAIYCYIMARKSKNGGSHE